MTIPIQTPNNMLKHSDTQLLSPKELAWRLNRHPNYVYLMKKAGFKMPGYRATVEDSLAWLDANPEWRRTLDN
jgi:hypothetical protein